MSCRILISLHSTNDDLINLYRQLFARNQLTDVVIVTEGQHFHAHRILLALYSEYFRELFLNVAVNASKPDLFVCLKDVSFATLRYIIDLIYEGKVKVRVEDLDDFLVAAKYLQISGFYDNDRPISSDTSIGSNKTTVSSDETTDSPINSDGYCSIRHCYEINLKSNCGNYIKCFNGKTKSDVRGCVVTIPLQKRVNLNKVVSTLSENKIKPVENLRSEATSSNHSPSDEICQSSPSKQSNTSGEEAHAQMETYSHNCNFCSHTYARKDQLKNHQRVHHLFLLLQNKAN